jgi:hypothetical protein
MMVWLFEDEHEKEYDIAPAKFVLVLVLGYLPKLN